MKPDVSLNPHALPAEQPQLRVMTMPADTNPAGVIFGGWLMSHVDVAASIPAIRRAQGRVTTVAVNAMQFHQPLQVGDLVSFFAEVVAVGRTSITVQARVYAERLTDLGRCVHITDATLTFVAIDAQGQPRQVPELAA